MVLIECDTHTHANFVLRPKSSSVSHQHFLELLLEMNDRQWNLISPPCSLFFFSFITQGHGRSHLAAKNTHTHGKLPKLQKYGI